MRKLIPLLLLLVGSISIAQNYDPILPKKAKSLNELVPKEWILLYSAKGDLNQDGISDLVFVVQSMDAAHIEFLDYMDNSVNKNPRVLGIYFGSKNGDYTQNTVSKNFILF